MQASGKIRSRGMCLVTSVQESYSLAKIVMSLEIVSSCLYCKAEYKTHIVMRLEHSDQAFDLWKADRRGDRSRVCRTLCRTARQ